MLYRMLKSKLHMATATEARLDYHGSITIDQELMDEVGFFPYEAVLVANMANGMRAETYAIPGEAGQKTIGLNGAMARLAQPGDRLIIMSFAFCDPKEQQTHRPRVVILNQENCVIERIQT